MASDKRFYWIKLKTDFFNLDKIDFLLSQKNGCEYIVLYQMLCLRTANNGGRLCTEIGEMIVPYDIEKIVRETKYFDFDTVAVALELFKKLGLVYVQDDNILKVAAIDEMVGSETAGAQRVRKHREKKALQCNTQVTEKALQSNIEIDIRDREKSIDIDIEKEKKKMATSRFTPPTLEEVKAYCLERKNNVDPERFLDYYTSNGWVVGKNKMKDWKAAIRTWERNGYSNNTKRNSNVTQLVTINGKEYECRNGKYYIPNGSGIEVNPYAEDDLPY